MLDASLATGLFRYNLLPREKVLAKLSSELCPKDTELQTLMQERQTYFSGRGNWEDCKNDGLNQFLT